MLSGLLVVDKPRGMTSHDVVDRVRRLADQREAGHAGTLDPLATGVLVVALGKALKLLEFMEGHDKEYDVAVRLGQRTETDDAEGRVVEERPVEATRAQVEAAAAKFNGEIEQVPPSYSAVKQEGERLYAKARRGEAVSAKPRRVRVDEFALTSFEPPVARFHVRCGKGTYVRALARDLGAALGCGGHVAELRRTASGPFRLTDAAPLEAPLELMPMDTALMSLPEVRLTTQDAREFENGRTVALRPPGPLVRVYCGPRFAGIGEESGGKLKPRKVIVV
jgi:tRNA pseudouridine55 synthase